MSDLKYPISVLVADDHTLFRQSISAVLESRPNIVKVGGACNGVEVFELLNQEKWDIILLDVEMPEMNGFDVLTRLDPVSAPPVIMISFSDSVNDIRRSYQLGAKGYLLKECSIEELIGAMSVVMEGSTYISPHTHYTSFS